MRTNEMGNQATSGIVLEEEKPVIEAPKEGSFEARDEDKETNGGEIGEIPEDQTETLPDSDIVSDVAEKGGEIDRIAEDQNETIPYSNIVSDVAEKGGEINKIAEDQNETVPYSNIVSDVAEKVQESEESEPVDSLETDESANQEDEYTEKANGEFDIQIQEQYSIETEKVDQEANSDSSNSMVESLVQDLNPDDDSAIESEEPQNVSILISTEAEKLHESSHIQTDIYTEDKISDLILEECINPEDKPTESESNISSEIPEPEQNQLVQAEEMYLASHESEIKEKNQPDSEQANKEMILSNNKNISSKQEEEEEEEQNDISIPEENDQENEESPIINNEANETLPRISTDSNQSVLLRKSPSFEFGIPLDSRSEESDQTPLLVRDKSLARSISGKIFQASMIPPDFNYAEEKTIRMERSTSDISRNSSFISFLKKDADIDTDTPPDQLQEMALTSVKGKPKARASFFSACICCSAAIH